MVNKHCKRCNDLVECMAMYDAYWCEGCDIWLSSHCPDEECEYCVPRPDKPSDVPEEDRESW